MFCIQTQSWSQCTSKTLRVSQTQLENNEAQPGASCHFTFRPDVPKTKTNQGFAIICSPGDVKRAILVSLEKICFYFSCDLPIIFFLCQSSYPLYEIRGVKQYLNQGLINPIRSTSKSQIRK